MTINVNNQSKSIVENTSVTALLAQLNIVANGIAIAINNEVVARENWGNVNLKNQDQVTIIKATQGG